MLSEQPQISQKSAGKEGIILLYKLAPHDDGIIRSTKQQVDILSLHNPSTIDYAFAFFTLDKNHKY